MLGQLGRTGRLPDRLRPVLLPDGQPVAGRLPGLGLALPFFVAFAINVVALFARLRLVSTHEYTHLLDEHELTPCSGRAKCFRKQGSTHRASAPSPPWPATRCSTW
jgi:hypothetical protein